MIPFTNSNSIVENINKKIKKIKGGLYFLNSVFYISFLLQNQNKKYDILFLFFGIRRRCRCIIKRRGRIRRVFYIG